MIPINRSNPYANISFAAPEVTMAQFGSTSQFFPMNLTGPALPQPQPQSQSPGQGQLADASRLIFSLRRGSDQSLKALKAPGPVLGKA